MTRVLVQDDLPAPPKEAPRYIKRGMPLSIPDDAWGPVGAFFAGLLGLRGVQALVRKPGGGDDDLATEIRALAASVEDLSKAIEKQSDRIGDGFGRVHQRIDELMRGR